MSSTLRELNYYGQSPVRGQLESAEGFSKTGWRFLQCTDTPNELRVLLPPRTATLYGHLLSAEAAELAKGKAASWERVVEIRHLKDRMIRKCQRLARSSEPQGKPKARVMFYTVHAPPDFRLKEMERWFRAQGPEFAHVFGERAASQAPYCCEKGNAAQAQTHARPAPGPTRPRGAPQTYRTAAPPQAMPRRTGDTTAQRAVPHNISPPPLPLKPPGRARSSELRPPSRIPSVVRAPDDVPGGAADTRRGAYAASRTSHPRSDVQSPEPLPIPFRPREPSPQLQPPRPLVDDTIPFTESPEEIPPSPSQVSTLVPNDPPALALGEQALSTIHEAESQDGGGRPALPRRRSSLKKSNSMSRLSIASQNKSVAWAMDRDWTDQMAKFVEATNEADTLGNELEEVRTEHQEQIAVLRGLCKSVAQASERVRQETESLLREQQAVLDQEDRLIASCERLQLKEGEFREKVVAVLEETKRVVQLCDKKRDVHECT
ncbi:hypothetical protein CERSUDRAFT_120900 [Gelatoporia subvermispora B]|uniref:Uncharacterized protein n=1 Tax=Ceriporiopsis subvermispora (strain B) TaxID=914234 RepID=M2QY50_CERS8|nr:hypothetical protein CERSUDRAFT_120900 [Gelatoporia subvermispora B]